MRRLSYCWQALQPARRPARSVARTRCPRGGAHSLGRGSVGTGWEESGRRGAGGGSGSGPWRRPASGLPRAARVGAPPLALPPRLRPAGAEGRSAVRLRVVARPAQSRSSAVGARRRAINPPAPKRWPDVPRLAVLRVGAGDAWRRSLAGVECADSRRVSGQHRPLGR